MSTSGTGTQHYYTSSQPYCTSGGTCVFPNVEPPGTFEIQICAAPESPSETDPGLGSTASDRLSPCAHSPNTYALQVSSLDMRFLGEWHNSTMAGLTVSFADNPLASRTPAVSAPNDVSTFTCADCPLLSRIQWPLAFAYQGVETTVYGSLTVKVFPREHKTDNAVLGSLSSVSDGDVLLSLDIPGQVDEWSAGFTAQQEPQNCAARTEKVKTAHGVQWAHCLPQADILPAPGVGVSLGVDAERATVAFRSNDGGMHPFELPTQVGTVEPTKKAIAVFLSRDPDLGKSLAALVLAPLFVVALLGALVGLSIYVVRRRRAGSSYTPL